MDRVRFGRALGTGARDAARAMLKAADAATAPNPGATSARATPAQARSAQAQTTDRVADTVQQVRATTTGIRQGTKLFGKAVGGPVARVSAIVWLEVTGFIFALFALAAAGQIWLHRADLHTQGPAHNNLLAAAGLFVLFGFLTVQSYIRAHRRSRR
jgi:hypothetical protein